VVKGLVTVICHSCSAFKRILRYSATDRRTDRITVYRIHVIKRHYEWVFHVVTTDCRCEVRPGPEFLLRKYLFYASGRFDLIQFYYADSQCREPAFSIEARGVFRRLHPSWTVRGGTDLDYETTHVAVVSYTEAVAAALQRSVNNTCNVGTFRKFSTRTDSLPMNTTSRPGYTRRYGCGLPWRLLALHWMQDR